MAGRRYLREKLKYISIIDLDVIIAIIASKLSQEGNKPSRCFGGLMYLFMTLKILLFIYFPFNFNLLRMNSINFKIVILSNN